MYSSYAFTSDLQFNLRRHSFKCRHEKINCLDTCGTHDETVKCDYDRQPSWLEGGQRDVV